MNEVVTIFPHRQPNRPHFIAEWAEMRNLRQTDLARELNADKSVISRWFKGTTPSAEWQEKLAALFGCDRESLFRHPSEDWIKRFFEGRSKEEIERIQATLEAAFPRKTG